MSASIAACAAGHRRRLHVPARRLFAQDAPVDVVVVHDQHRNTGQRRIGARGARQIGVVERGGEVERAADVGRAVHPDAAAHHPHERRGDRQAEAGAAEFARRRSIGLAERLEDRRLLVGGHADAGIGHRKMQERALAAAHVLVDFDQDVPAVGELDRVAHQVAEHLSQANRIADDAFGHVRVDVSHQLEPFLVRLDGQRLEQIGDDIADREGHGLELELARFDLREIQDVVEDRQQRLGGALDGRQALALLQIEIGIERQLGHADDAVHRRANLVAHVGEELAFRAARFHRLVARFDRAPYWPPADPRSGRRQSAPARSGVPAVPDRAPATGPASS